MRLFFPILILVTQAIAGGFAPPKDSYFTYIDRHWVDTGFFISPGIWESAVASGTLGGVMGGLTWRKRVPAGAMGTLIELAFQRYENGSSNVRFKTLQGGTTDFFLPAVFSFNLFYNGGKYTRQMGHLAPFAGLGLALIGIHQVDITGTTNLQGMAPFGQLGIEFVPVTPTVGVRLSARLGAETAGAGDAISYLTGFRYEFKFFYSFSAGLVVYLQ